MALRITDDLMTLEPMTLTFQRSPLNCRWTASLPTSVYRGYGSRVSCTAASGALMSRPWRAIGEP
jgi:hypothetical protein